MDELEELREITKGLPKLSDLRSSTRGHLVEYLGGNRVIIALGLLDDEKCGVAQSLIPAGACLPEHQHNSREWIIVYEGSLVISGKGKDRTVLSGDYIVFEPGELHTIRATENTWCIAVSVPRDTAYPD